MSEEQLKEDMAMTPLERLELAFQISDFALALRQQHDAVKEEPSTTPWIELRKISSCA